MFKDELKQYVENNPKLVYKRELGNGLFLLKYKKIVFYKNLWNQYLEECRGTIVDDNFNIVSRPFTKIYNYGIDQLSPVFADDTPVDAYRKVNGFMVAVTWHNGELLVSTTGTTDSSYVDMAKQLIDPELYSDVCRQWFGTTFLFECVHPDDPHIIPETPGMYLIGYRDKTWNSRSEVDPKLLHMFSVLLNTQHVEHFKTTVGELVKLSKTVKHEGFVFYTPDGQSAKIKSPYYLTKKWVARNPNTDKLMRDSIYDQIDEEYYPLLDHIRANIEDYTAMDEQSRLTWVRQYLEGEPHGN